MPKVKRGGKAYMLPYTEGGMMEAERMAKKPGAKMVGRKRKTKTKKA